MAPSFVRLAIIAALALPATLSSAHPASFLHPGSVHDCKPIQKRQLIGSGSEGGPSDGPSSSAAAAGYSCDATKCKLPNCQCASTSPPGGLDPKDVPQFVTFTADDAVQVYTVNSLNQFLAQRKNPNGCTPVPTYFTSLNYTNYSMVTDAYVGGWEIADHTMTHVGDAPVNEIDGNIIALNALSGIPQGDIIGFRAPYLNYSVATLQHLHDAQFTYDSSMTSATPANESDTDAFWPYTLDYGVANDCLSVDGLCQGKLKLPGLWEIPMYGIFDERQTAGVHLMDPWLDSSNPNDVLNWMKSTFLTHYNGNRQPFGLYSHPIHVATGYPGLQDPVPQINMINQFLDWVQQQPNVWIVSNKQLLAWLKNPVPVAQLGSIPELGCKVPQVSAKICNGMTPNQNGLLDVCPFADYYWATCYGCPTVEPLPTNPNPPQASASSGGLRHRLPQNCSTPFWDPIAGTCLCTSSDCQYTSQTRPIGPNGANLTGGGTGGSTNSSASAGASATSIYTPFSSDAFGGLRQASVGGAMALFVAALSAGLLLIRRA